MEGCFFPRFGSAVFSKVWLDPPFSFPCNCHHFWTLRYEKCQLSQGSRGVTVAILVTVDVFRLSDDVLNSKMSTVTGIAEGRVAILVTVDGFGLPHVLGDSKVSTVTGISGVRVAILVTVDAFELSDQFRI